MIILMGRLRYGYAHDMAIAWNAYRMVMVMVMFYVMVMVMVTVIVWLWMWYRP